MADGFGNGPFGRSDWSHDVLVGLLPEVYIDTDNVIDGGLQDLMASIVPSFDEIYDKISKLGDLRDPLKCPTDSVFTESVLIIEVTNLGDGTSRVFLSQGSAGDIYDGIKIGYNLKDSSGNIFEIIEKNASELPTDFTSPPTDPYTGNPTGKNIIVNNIIVNGQETIPLVAGHTYTTSGTNSSPPANGVSQIANISVVPLDDGFNVGPYTITVALPPIALNLVTITWTEGGNSVSGYFNSSGRYFGQLTVGTSINYTTGTIVMANASGGIVDASSIRVTYTTLLSEVLHPVTTPAIDGVSVGPYVFTLPLAPVNAYRVIFLWTESSVAKTGAFDSSGTPVASLHGSSTISFTTGTISFKSSTGNPIDANSLDVWYWPVGAPLIADATVSAPNLLVYLGNDYDVAVDQNEPETFQRSSVYNAYQLWDIKGAERSYEVMGDLHGFTVRPHSMCRISQSFADSFRAAGITIYEFPDLTINETPGAIPPGSIFPPNDGLSLGPYAINVTYGPICVVSSADDQPRITLTWTESAASRSITYNSQTSSWSGSMTSISSVSLITVGLNKVGINVTFVSGHIPDARSMSISYVKSVFYTTIAPFTLYMDEVVLDAIPLDTYCADSDFPTVNQSITITSTALVTAHEVGVSRWSVVVDDTGNAYNRFGTEGYIQSNPSVLIENFKYLTPTTYSFEVVQASAPALGAATMVWHVLKQVPASETDNPGNTPDTTISPAEDGMTVGPFTIQLANFPLTSGNLTIAWQESTVAKTATLSGTSTLSGPNAANIASATITRSTGVLVMTFAMGHPPDVDSIRITYPPVSDFAIAGINVDTFALGVQYQGYTGIRYRTFFNTSDAIDIASVGHWKIIDSNGVQSWIEECDLIFDPTTVPHLIGPPSLSMGPPPTTVPYQYVMEYVSGTVPATGPANILYSCAEIPSCIYCAASGILMTVDANTILNYPSAAAYVSSGAALTSIENRLTVILPAHVRVVDFVSH